MIGNKLSVKPNKTKYLLFNSKNINVPVIINLNLNSISPSKSTKNFDIIFLSDMSMDKHIFEGIMFVCFHPLAPTDLLEQEDENFEGRHLTANNDDEDSEKSEDEGSRDRFRSERTNNSVPKKYVPNNPPNALGLLELI